MSKYIDAETVFNELTNRYKMAQGEERKAYREAIDIVSAVADIELVRCRDCRYNYANLIPNGSGCSMNVELKAEAEWYCADGERDE